MTSTTTTALETAVDAPARSLDRARREDGPALASALAAAFHDDPVFRWFSPDARRRAAMLPAFFETYVAVYSSHGEAYADALCDGAALWAPPGSDPLSADPRDLERLQQIAGADTPRLFEIVELLEAHAPAAPHYHLQILGVRPGRQGSGLGSALMAPILERCDRRQVPAYLEATSDRNRALYERHGFRVRDEIAPPGGPSLWTMWREPLS